MTDIWGGSDAVSLELTALHKVYDTVWAAESLKFVCSNLRLPRFIRVDRICPAGVIVYASEGNKVAECIRWGLDHNQRRTIITHQYTYCR